MRTDCDRKRTTLEKNRSGKGDELFGSGNEGNC